MHVLRVPRGRDCLSLQQRRQIRLPRVQAVQDPYSTLGVPADADQHTIKKAFRKLALKHHPDVAADKATSEVKFLKLTAAYEYLVGKLRGKDMSDFFDEHGERKKQEGTWDFHDWYWHFRINRSWSRQKQRQSVANSDEEGLSEGACGEEGPQHARAFEPGFKTQEARDNLRSQLSGLRQRAARRATRSPSPPPSPRAATFPAGASTSTSSHTAPSQAHPFSDASGASLSATASYTSSMESDTDDEAEDARARAYATAAMASAQRKAASPAAATTAHHTTEPPLHHHVAFSAHVATAAAHTAPMSHAAPDAKHDLEHLPLGHHFGEDMSASFDELWGGQGQEHEAFNRRFTPNGGSGSGGSSSHEPQLTGAHVRESHAQQHHVQQPEAHHTPIHHVPLHHVQQPEAHTAPIHHVPLHHVQQQEAHHTPIHHVPLQHHHSAHASHAAHSVHTTAHTAHSVAHVSSPATAAAAAAAAAAFDSTASAPGATSSAASVDDSIPHDSTAAAADGDCAAAGASCGHGFAAQYRAGPHFTSTQDRREAVTHQLAGLRRKANIAMQHRGGNAGGSSD